MKVDWTLLIACTGLCSLLKAEDALVCHFIDNAHNKTSFGTSKLVNQPPE